MSAGQILDRFYAALTGLLSVTERPDAKKIIAEGSDAGAPAEGTVLVAEWHQIKNSKIWHVESAFDGRPYEVMFTGGGKA